MGSRIAAHVTNAGLPVVMLDIVPPGTDANGKTTQFVYHAVTGNFFSGLRLVPLLGRTFQPGEGEHSGVEATVVLGYDFWQRRFGGDPDLVGTMVRLDGIRRIIGIAPPGFYGLYRGPTSRVRALGSLRRRARTRPYVADRLRYLTVTARRGPASPSRRRRVGGRHRASARAPRRDVSARVLPERWHGRSRCASCPRLLPLIRGRCSSRDSSCSSRA
jgi:hypothetical protein